MAKELYGSLDFYRDKDGNLVCGDVPKTEYPELFEAMGNWFHDEDWYDDNYFKKTGRYKPKSKECECGLEKADAGGKHSPWCPIYKEDEEE